MYHGRSPGVGPGLTFALEMLKEDPQATIDLLPCVVGGVPLRRRVKGDGLHFSADAEKESGARFAKAMRELQKRRGPQP